MQEKTNLAILIFDDMEILDFAGPYEIFSVVGGDDDFTNPFNVYTVAEKKRPVIARNNLTIIYKPLISTDSSCRCYFIKQI